VPCSAVAAVSDVVIRLRVVIRVCVVVVCLHAVVVVLQ
jgi:hypothetical protein